MTNLRITSVSTVLAMVMSSSKIIWTHSRDGAFADRPANIYVGESLMAGRREMGGG